MLDTASIHLKSSFINYDIWNLSAHARIGWFTMLFLADDDGAVPMTDLQIAALARTEDQHGPVTSWLGELIAEGELEELDLGYRLCNYKHWVARRQTRAMEAAAEKRREARRGK